MHAVVRLNLTDKKFSTDSEYLFAEVAAVDPSHQRREILRGTEWDIEAEPEAERGQIVRYDRALLRRFPALARAAQPVLGRIEPPVQGQIDQGIS